MSYRLVYFDISVPYVIVDDLVYYLLSLNYTSEFYNHIREKDFLSRQFNGSNW